MTVTELGDACGLTHASISQYETGLSEPSSDALLPLSLALKVTVDYLVGRTEYGIDDLLSDDRMSELLEGFVHLSYDRRHMLHTFFEALEVFEERKRESVKMTEYGIPEKMRYKVSETGSVI